jgi:hypothetical protein
MALTSYFLIVAGILAAVYGVYRLVLAVGVYRRFKGNRIVSCPENHQPAAVRVAAGQAAFGAVTGNPQVHLGSCSRWPERQDCPQACLAQINDEPKACLVETIANRWYEGQKCVFCQKPFLEINWLNHPPALLNQERKSVLWNEIPAENLQQAMKTHLPICWSCHIAETFRREHPEAVVDRPASPLRMNLYH